MIMIKACPGHQDSRTSNALFYVILILIAAIYYIFLAMDGSFNVQTPRAGSAGNDVQQRVGASPARRIRRRSAAVAFEGVVRDGKTYIYFGILPALLRLPFLPTGALAWLDITGLYCALAATVALSFKLASVVLINDNLPKSRLQALAFFVIVLSLFLGGAQIQFLRGTVYVETLEWAGAISAAFMYCSLRGLIAKREFSFGGSSTPSPWHTDAVGGRPPHHPRSARKTERLARSSRVGRTARDQPSAPMASRPRQYLPVDTTSRSVGAAPADRARGHVRQASVDSGCS
jgi:hypothetical protein